MVPLRDRRLHEAAKRYESLLGEAAQEARMRARRDRAHGEVMAASS